MLKEFLQRCHWVASQMSHETRLALAVKSHTELMPDAFICVAVPEAASANPCGLLGPVHCEACAGMGHRQGMSLTFRLSPWMRLSLRPRMAATPQPVCHLLATRFQKARLARCCTDMPPSQQVPCADCQHAVELNEICAWSPCQVIWEDGDRQVVEAFVCGSNT